MSGKIQMVEIAIIQLVTFVIIQKYLKLLYKCATVISLWHKQNSLLAF